MKLIVVNRGKLVGAVFAFVCVLLLLQFLLWYPHPLEEGRMVMGGRLYDTSEGNNEDNVGGDMIDVETFFDLLRWRF